MPAQVHGDHPVPRPQRPGQRGQRRPGCRRRRAEAAAAALSPPKSRTAIGSSPASIRRSLITKSPPFGGGRKCRRRAACSGSPTAARHAAVRMPGQPPAPDQVVHALPADPEHRAGRGVGHRLRGRMADPAGHGPARAASATSRPAGRRRGRPDRACEISRAAMRTAATSSPCAASRRPTARPGSGPAAACASTTSSPSSSNSSGSSSRMSSSRTICSTSSARPATRPANRYLTPSCQVARLRVDSCLVAERPLTEPHPSRLALDHPRRAEILAAHAAALDGGQAGYLDPDTGLFVLTAGFLADRGTCCGRGCRHCPYVDGV